MKEKIWSFIRSNYVLTICTQSAEVIWAASLFYAADKECLYVMSDLSTRHGSMMLENNNVSGTIAVAVEDISQICGLQFTGKVTLLKGTEEEKALQLYEKRFPVAKTFRAAVWQINFTELKLTDNNAGFGTKYYWRV